VQTAEKALARLKLQWIEMTPEAIVAALQSAFKNSNSKFANVRVVGFLRSHWLNFSPGLRLTLSRALRRAIRKDEVRVQELWFILAERPTFKRWAQSWLRRGLFRVRSPLAVMLVALTPLAPGTVLLVTAVLAAGAALAAFRPSRPAFSIPLQSAA
jgi:hypothetical protein